MFLAGLSDLAVVQLKHVVQVGLQPRKITVLENLTIYQQEHADYELGDPISAIELATSSPQEGDQVEQIFHLPSPLLQLIRSDPRSDLRKAFLPIFTSASTDLIQDPI